MIGSVVKRETWLSAQVGSSVHLAKVNFLKQAIDNTPLSDIDALTLVLSVSVAPINAANDPTVDIFLQRAIVPNPDYTNDAHWEDMYHFTQITKDTATGPLESVDLPIDPNAATNVVANYGGVVSQLAIAAKTGKLGRFYDRLRIVEKNGGTGVPTTPCTYTVNAIGVAQDS